MVQKPVGRATERSWNSSFLGCSEVAAVWEHLLFWAQWCTQVQLPFALSLGFSMACSFPLLLLLMPLWLWELDEGPTTCSSPYPPLPLLALWPHPGALQDTDAGSFTVVSTAHDTVLGLWYSVFLNGWGVIQRHGASLPIKFLKYRLLPLNTSNLILRVRWSTWKMPARAYFLLFEVVKITLLHINSKFPHNFLKHNRSIKHARVLSRFSHVQLCVTLWTM